MSRGSAWLVAAALVMAAGLAGCAANTTSGRGTARTSSSRPGIASTPLTVRPSSSSSAAPAGCTGACFTDPATVAAVLAAARADVAAANSYDYRTMTHSLATALAATTGGYRIQLRHTFTTVVEPEAQRRHISQQVHVTAAGIETLSSDGATATALVTATLHIAGRSVNRLDPVQLHVTLTRVAGRWLISRLIPVGIAAGTADAQAPGSPQLAAAQAAGDREIAAVGTFSHATFGHDLQRALAGTTGAFRADMVHTLTTLRAQAKAPDFRLASRVPYSAVVTAAGDEVTILVALDIVRGKGRAAAHTTSDDLITVTAVNGHWLLSAARTVGVS